MNGWIGINLTKNKKLRCFERGLVAKKTFIVGKIFHRIIFIERKLGKFIAALRKKERRECGL